MSNKAHDHVHRLVCSMTRAEKRYFKLYTGRHMPGGRSNQQTLFDAIAAMRDYDEKALLDRFGKEAFTHRFAITKRRLYEAILRSLDAFHAEGSVDARLARLLHQVELLHGRALYADAAKLLTGVRRLARRHDRHAALGAVLLWERRLLEVANYGGAGAKDLARIARESRELRDEQAEQDELWDLKSRLFLGLYRQGQVRDATGMEEVRALLGHPLLRDPARLRTAKARFLFHHAHGAAAFATGDLETCHHHLYANRDLLTTQQERFGDEPNLVLGVLSNLVYVCVRLGRYEEAFARLREFRGAPAAWSMPDTEDIDLKLFSTSTSLELAVHTRMGAFGKAVELVPATERGLARYGERMGPMRMAGLQYQLAYAHFGAGRPDLALKWIHQLFNGTPAGEGEEVACFGRMLHLLALLDAGRMDLLPYALRNTERHMRNRGRAHRFEQALLAMVRDMLRAKGEEALRAALRRFLDAVLPLEQEPMEQVVFDHLDPVAWAEGRLTGQPFAELVRTRAMGGAKAA